MFITKFGYRVLCIVEALGIGHIFESGAGCLADITRKRRKTTSCSYFDVASAPGSFSAPLSAFSSIRKDFVETWKSWPIIIDLFFKRELTEEDGIGPVRQRSSDPLIPGGDQRSLILRSRRLKPDDCCRETTQSYVHSWIWPMSYWPRTPASSTMWVPYAIYCILRVFLHFQVLESLDMSQHSLGYLAVLVAKLGQVLLHSHLLSKESLQSMKPSLRRTLTILGIFWPSVTNLLGQQVQSR